MLGWQSSWASWIERATEAISSRGRFILSLCRAISIVSLGITVFSLIDGPSVFLNGISLGESVDLDNGFPSREISLETIGSFGFGQIESGWVEEPDLLGQFSLLSLSSRPDLSIENDSEFYVYLTKSKKVMKAYPEVDYLFVMQGAALIPTDDGTVASLRVRFNRVQGGEIWVRFSPTRSTSLFTELKEGDLFAPLNSMKVKNKEASGFDVQYLSSIGFQWAGKDLILEQSSGVELQHIGLFRMKGVTESSLHMRVGDCLFQEDGEWFVTSPGERTRGKIIFQLEEVTDSRLLFSVWDLQGGVKRGLYLSKVQEGLDLGSIRELRLSAVRSAEHVVLQIRQQRLSVRLGDYLVVQHENGDRLFVKVVPKGQTHEPGTYIWIKSIVRSKGRWQVEANVYSYLRSKFISCLITDNSFGYKNLSNDPKQSLSQAAFLFKDKLRWTAF
ncbi:hypothetical protein [Candidatus Similichlamydia epinepheli]|uniref:hypothetical protein n=1 Tax=Candidatus Similichlamydia epinepheli TaxID=1903953 RepID=UPI0013006B0E|nr:hypothetical protein [Candidatus Similichlamydia epinepheli]